LNEENERETDNKFIPNVLNHERCTLLITHVNIIIFFYTPAPEGEGVHVYCLTPVCLSVRNKFSSQFPQQLYHILFFFLHVMWWDSFLCESDDDFLFICASVRNVYMKFWLQFPQQLLIIDAWHFKTLFLLACHMVVTCHIWWWHAIWWDSFVCESDILLIRASVRKVYMKFSSQFHQQLLIADAWHFNTFFLLACHMVGYIFVWIRWRLPVYPCVCP
jgi:hypothetical protein